MTTRRSRSYSRPYSLTQGTVHIAYFTRDVPFITQGRSQGAKAAGRQYEKKVQEYLLSRFPESYVNSPWIRYQSIPGAPWRLCQPDGLLIDIQGGKITVVEIKIRHCAEAWWQVRRLYEPVVQCIFGADCFEYAAVEVVRWYDPHTHFPESFTLVNNPATVDPTRFGVHICQP